jgi:predicted transcriptional regulator
MSRPIAFEISDEIYERIEKIARNSNRSPESILRDSVTMLFGSTEASLSSEAMEALSDAELWAVAQQHLAFPVDTRLRALTELGKLGKLTEPEQQELEQLVDRYDEYVWQRSQALLLLKQRGHDVEQRLSIGA